MTNFPNTLPVHPDDQGVPVGDQDPLPDVKLGVVDEEGPLNVLLDHVPCLPGGPGQDGENLLEPVQFILQLSFKTSCSRI